VSLAGWLENPSLVDDSDSAGHDEGECWYAKTMHYGTLFQTASEAVVEWRVDENEAFGVRDW
jgi:hypothetical protein